MKLTELRVPSVAEYEAAFRAIEKRITEKQRAMIREHHRSPGAVTTASQLAESVGYPNYETANLQYGLLAKMLSDELGLPEKDAVEIGILVDFVPPDTVANEHYLWVLRPNVARALENLGWAPKLSHLLYPQEYLQSEC